MKHLKYALRVKRYTNYLSVRLSAIYPAIQNLKSSFYPLVTRKIPQITLLRLKFEVFIRLMKALVLICFLSLFEFSGISGFKGSFLPLQVSMDSFLPLLEQLQSK